MIYGIGFEEDSSAAAGRCTVHSLEQTHLLAEADKSWKAVLDNGYSNIAIAGHNAIYGFVDSLDLCRGRDNHR